MLRFFVSIVAVAILSVAIVFWVHHLGWINHRPSLLWEILILLVLTNALIFKYLYNAQKPALFVQLYLGTIAIKLLAYCTFCLWMILADKPGAALNITFFMSVYLLFTALEIAFLFRKISRENEP